MKAFESWKESNCEACPGYASVICKDCNGIGSKEQTWRAALEWVLEHRYETTNDMGLEGEVIDATIIENELGGK